MKSVYIVMGSSCGGDFIIDCWDNREQAESQLNDLRLGHYSSYNTRGEFFMSIQELKGDNLVSIL